jgi:hypothetical protein
MYKLFQITFIFILSSSFLANIGFNQSEETVLNSIDAEKQAKELKKFINAQDDETSDRILSLQVATLESISMLSNYETQDETSDLMQGELTKIKTAIDNLNSSSDLNYELSYLEENLKLIQSELTSAPAKPIDLFSIDCGEVTRSIVTNNELTLFHDPLAKSGNIKAVVAIKPSIDNTQIEMNIQVFNKHARDVLGGLEQNTLLIFESANGNLIKCINTKRSYGIWKDDSMSLEYTTTFTLPANCQFYDPISKVKLIWANGLQEYNIADKKAINNFLACQCKNS